MPNFLNNILHHLGLSNKKNSGTFSNNNIHNDYDVRHPSDQNMLDIFAGEWSSRLPDKYGLTTQPGPSALFNDDRILWCEKVFESLQGFNILELGPLEAGHSYMFQNMDANKVTAIEANKRALLKCLVIKELLQLDRVEFKLGDFNSYLKDSDTQYDLICASGVMYHLSDPLTFIEQIAMILTET